MRTNTKIFDVTKPLILEKLKHSKPVEYTASVLTEFKNSICGTI